MLLSVAAYAVGLPDLANGDRSPLVLSFAAPVAAATGISMFQLVTGDALLPRAVVFLSAACLVPWYAACARLASQAHDRARQRDRLLVVADADEAQYLRDDLGRQPERPAQLVGVLDVDAARCDMPSDGPVVRAAAERQATAVVLDRTAQLDESVVAQAALLHERGLRIRTLTGFYEEWLGKLPIGELERLALMFDIAEVHRARYARATRLLDLVLATVGTVVLAVSLPFVLLGNVIANRGPLLYRQLRTGRNGRTFNILKFRTMRPAGDHLVNEWTTEDDPRITPFGRLMRRTHLDELPQVVNVLRGDLSLVGPRPEQPHYVAELVEKIPFYDLRHLVRPGITGWAQVKYGYAGNESDALEKLQYEFFYLRHQSLALDVRILMRTLRGVASLGGR